MLNILLMFCNIISNIRVDRRYCHLMELIKRAIDMYTINGGLNNNFIIIFIIILSLFLIAFGSSAEF